MSNFLDEYPRKGQTLFTANGGKFEVARVGQGDIFSQLSNYVLGYFQAANDLFDKLEEKMNFFKHCSGDSLQSILDEYAPPIIFLYRHYLELSLKGIYLEYSGASPSEQVEMINKTGHNLEIAFKYSKPIIESVLDDDMKDSFLAFENYITQFQSNDFYSDIYRYPFGKNFKENQNFRRINLFNIKERMCEIESFLSDIMPELDFMKFSNISNNNRECAIKFWDENKLQEAIDKYLEALQTKKHLIGEIHFDVLIGYTEIGILYLENEQLKEAHDYLLRALYVYGELKNDSLEKNFDVSRILNFIGLIYERNEKYQEAIVYYTQALNETCADIRQIIIAYKGIVYGYEQQNNTTEAIKYLEKAVSICEENYGLDHEETFEVKDMLNTITNGKK